MSQENDELERKKKDALERRKELARLLSPEFRLTERIEKLTERVETDAEEARRRDEANQRTIEFILQQQAQFNAGMQQLRESQARSELRWERTEGSIRALLELAQIHEREITALAEAQAQTDRQIRESQAQTDRQMKETDGRFKETDERLNALINTVERIISERRNGRNGGGQAAEGEGPQGGGQR